MDDIEQLRVCLAERDRSIQRLRIERDRLKILLRCIRGWDQLDSADDGAYWKHEIDVLIEEPDTE